MTVITAGNPTFALRIEGLGVDDGQVYFSTERPAWDSLGLWRPILYKDPDPQSSTGTLVQFSESGNFRTGATTLADMMIRVTPNTEEWEWFHAHIFPVAIDSLGASISAVATTITFASGAPTAVGAGDPIWIGREAILLGVDAGGGTFTGCTRGVFETRAVGHDSLLGQDIDIYPRWVSPQGRKIVFGMLDEIDAKAADGSVSAFKVITSFALQKIGSVDGGLTVGIESLGLGYVAQNTKLYDRRRWRGRVWFVSDSVAVVTQVLPRGDVEGFFPLAFPASPSKGSDAWVRLGAGAYPMELANDVLPGTQIYRVLLDNPLQYTQGVSLGDPNEGTLADVSEGDQCWEILSSHPEAPSPPILFGFNTLPLGNSRDDRYGDVISILLNLLTSTDRGDNGDYDLGRSMGVDMDVGKLDVADLEAKRGRYASRWQNRHLFVGVEDTAPEPLDWIQNHLLAPYRMFFAVNDSGLWTVKILDDIVPITTTVPALSFLRYVGGVATSYDTGLQDVIDSVSMEYQGSATGETKRLDMRNETARELTQNGAGDLTVEAIGVATDDDAFRIGTVHQQSWRIAKTTFEFSTLLKDRILVGDPFEITDPQLPNIDTSTGQPVRGAIATLAYCTGLTTHLEGPESRADHKAILWGMGQGNLGYLDIGLEVATGFVYNVGNPGVIEFEANRYNSPSSDGYQFDQDIEPVAVGWFLRHMDEFGDEITAAIEVSVVNLGTDELTFTGYPPAWDAGSPPVAGDLFQSAAWDSLDAGQENLVHLAKANGNLGAADDPGFNWVL